MISLNIKFLILIVKICLKNYESEDNLIYKFIIGVSSSSSTL